MEPKDKKTPIESTNPMEPKKSVAHRWKQMKAESGALKPDSIK